MAKKSRLSKDLAAGNLPLPGMMTAGEVIEHFHLGDAGRIGKQTPVGQPKGSLQKQRDEDTMAYKLQDSKHPQSHDGTTSLYDSVAKKGSQSPVEVAAGPFDRPIVFDGHHRLAITRHLNPKQFINFDYV